METKDLKDKIKNAIDSPTLQTDVIDSVVSQFVKEEMESRKNILIDALRVLDTRTEELSKIKPDQITYGPDGKVLNESFSKKVIDNKLKLEKQVEELNSAIKNAIDNADYKKLKEKIRPGQSSDGVSGTSGTSGT